MAGIEIRGLSRHFRDRHQFDAARALDSFDLDVAPGELVVLVGPSGSGKTTLLRLLAGLDLPTTGMIRLGGKNLAGVPPHRRNVALVFQNLALYGHLRAGDNLAFGLDNGKQVTGDQVTQTAKLLGIEHLLQRFPAELSGGEQQRVALGRAIVRQPAALLLDEPLSSLDGPTRRDLRRELQRLQRQLGVPTIYVTHDQAEAMALGDRIAVLDRGRLQQVASPHDVYHRPANRFVANFFGPQGMNFVEGKLKRENGSTVFKAASVDLDVGSAAAGVSEGPVVCGFRPEHTELGELWKGNDCWSIESFEHFNDVAFVQVVDPNAVDCKTATRLVYCERAAHEIRRLEPDTLVSLRIPMDRLHWFDSLNGQRLGTT